MSDEQPGTTPEQTNTRTPSSVSPADNETHTPDGATPDGATPDGATPDGATRKRRRRGTRGGRNRKKRPTGTTSISAADTDDGELEREGVASRHEDWNDPGVDRGLTSEDAAEAAKAEAGLATPRPGEVVKPRIGDSRPAPAVAQAPTVPDEDEGATAPRKRRRRGGRRRRGSGSPGAAGAPVSTSTEPIEADLGIEDAIELDEATLERRRGTSRKGRATGRYSMVVHKGADGPTQIAVLEGRNLTEHYVSWPTDDATSIDGNIYLGRVQNVLPGMEAAFIDIGTPKNGVLYRGDVSYDKGDVEGGQPPKIERMLRNGQTIMVQVTKNPIAHKGARLTQEVSLAGRFVVMVPGQPETYGISKRLPDDERKRLRKILDGLRPADAGLIVRTAAEGATAEELERDMNRLKHQWAQISELAKRSNGGTLLYREPPLAVRVIREEFTKEYRSIVIDDRELFEEVHSYVEAIAPELVDRVEFSEEELPVFERFHVHEQLTKALDRKVWLPSGGSLIIERTEALTVIDVNTGKNVGKSNLEATVFSNNLEAADEIARQLRLRDIGGIIVIDFIDMEIKQNRDAVVERLRQALARDKTRTQVFEISELGLVEMTRKRVSEGLVEAFSDTCAACEGRGFTIDRALLDAD
ncbi:MAG: Rne/Rng family ribonuclease [Acidimicrobiia bacterium]